MYELLGICLALAVLLTINTAASIFVAAGWRFFEAPLRKKSARVRADILFAMRACPPTIAMISVGFFLIPSYVGYEPYSTNEVVSKKLAALAILSTGGVLFAVWRGLRSWFATRSLLREWLAVADQITLAGVSIPAYRIPHSFPIIAVVGTIRPRLFVAEQVQSTLSDEELIAAIAHERGHLTARDNLKRSLLRVCRDVLMIVPCGRALDRAWADSAEAAADEYAAQQSSETALDLASALIGIARMVPTGKRTRLPAAAFILGDDTTGVRARVKRLIALAGARPPKASAFVSHFGSIVLVVLLAALIFTLTCTHALASLHSAVERVVQLLA